MSEHKDYHVHVDLARDFQFVASFPDVKDAPSILFDEPAPLGDDRAPNATAVLGAAIGNCLAASFAFCLQRAHVRVDTLAADVTAHVVRNDAGRFRIEGIDVELSPGVAAADNGRLDRCRELFEDFCIVTASVRRGIPVNVTLNPAAVRVPRVA